MKRMLPMWIGLVISLSVVTALPANAATEPDNVAAQVADAAKTCRDGGGRPDTEAMLKVDDLNGDGAEDWIVDYAKLRCDGAINPFCGSGGCGLQIFLYAGGSRWRLAFDNVVRSYRFRSRGGRRLLEVQFGGAACGKVNAAACPKTYRFDRDGLIELR